VASIPFEKQYIESGKVRLVYHDYPLSGHRNAIPAAEAARCAGDQGQFWQMNAQLFENQRQWSGLRDPAAQFLTYAQQLKLDQASFSRCMSSATHRQNVLDARAAGDQLMLPGTPSFTVNGKLIDTAGVQTVDEIVARVAAAVDSALASP
jgi:protein-disulfide isomerase